MKDLEELGRLRDLGLLTNEEFETARREIFAQRSTVNDLVEDTDSDEPESGQIIENSEVDSAPEPDISGDNTEVAPEQNDNWWQASDGQWYPPEALDSLKEQGWFQDDDGQWYPPTQSVVEEPREVPLNQPTEVSSKQEPDQVFSATNATGINRDPETSTQQHDGPETRQPFNGLHSPKSYDSELVGSPQPKKSKGLSGGAKLLGVAVAGVIVIVGIVALVARSNTTLPTKMEPVRTALLSSTFGPWEDAQSAFIDKSRGEKKWEALMGWYRASFEEGKVSEKSEMSVTLRNDWYVIEYCAVGACEAGTNIFEIHLKKAVSGFIDDLRWFRGTKGSLNEVPLYEVRLDPEYVFDDPLQAWSDNPWDALRIGMDFDYAIQMGESGCLIGNAITPLGIIKGEMTVDGYDTSSLKDWTLFLGLYAQIRMADGLELESNYDGHPHTLEVNKSGEDKFVFCVDYNISEAVEFVVPGGKWSLYTDDGTKTYTNDFVVPFKVVEL